MVPLSTRNTTERGGLSVFNQIATIMMSGIVFALVFPMLIMPMLGVDKAKWIMMMFYFGVRNCFCKIRNYFQIIPVNIPAISLQRMQGNGYFMDGLAVIQ